MNTELCITLFLTAIALSFAVYRFNPWKEKEAPLNDAFEPKPEEKAKKPDPLAEYDNPTDLKQGEVIEVAFKLNFSDGVKYDTIVFSTFLGEKVTAQGIIGYTWKHWKRSDKYPVHVLEDDGWFLYENYTYLEHLPEHGIIEVIDGHWNEHPIYKDKFTYKYPDHMTEENIQEDMKLIIESKQRKLEDRRFSALKPSTVITDADRRQAAMQASRYRGMNSRGEFIYRAR